MGKHRTVVVLFTRDLRLHDQPALAAAVERAERVVPLFVLDDAVLATFGAPNRLAFLVDALNDLDSSLRARDGALVVRRGNVVGETVRLALDVGATAVFLSEDVSAYAQERERRLRNGLAAAGAELEVYPGVTVVPPGDLVPEGKDHFRVFTPYWIAGGDSRDATSSRLRNDSRCRRGSRPAGCPRAPSSSTARPPPTCPAAARPPAVADWTPGSTRGSRGTASSQTSSPPTRLRGSRPTSTSAVSRAGEVVARSLERAGSEAFVRQLCWRDFNHQLLAANPETAHADLRPRAAAWREDEEGLAAWREGRTGYPLVDAGMRQLLREGFMHNRARLVAGSFLTKHLGIDWRHGAAHFFEHLVDGDVANNTANWQWVAGTGTDSRPYRRLSPAVRPSVSTRRRLRAAVRPGDRHRRLP